MSHNKFPSTFQDQQVLQIAINKKHLTDADKSVLTAYMLANGIVWTTDLANGVEAAKHETKRLLYKGQSEQATISRNTTFKPVWMRTLLWIQFLKINLGGNVKLLTDWGITIDVNGNITFPTDFPSRAMISEKIIAKHKAYAAGTSPLLPFITLNGDDMEAFDAATTSAIASNASSVSLSIQSGIETAARNKIWVTPKKDIRLLGDFLMKLFTTDTSVVAEWGFNIVSLASVSKTRKSMLLPVQTRTITGIVLGTKLTNTGTADLIYYKGKKAVGTPDTVKAGEEVGMNKGCSCITVGNLSTTEKVLFTVVRK